MESRESGRRATRSFSPDLSPLIGEISLKRLKGVGLYGKGALTSKKGGKSKFVLDYKTCANIVVELKKELIAKKEASDLFGQERSDCFEGIIKGLYQTFAKKELYPTVEDKA